MTANKPLLMLTMPNSGSTWLARVIAENLPGCRYYDKEFFNPVCNMKHEVLLRQSFGSELASCYLNIATDGGPGIHDIIKATWGAEDYNFTKECQSVFKMRAFMEHFRVFVFVRSEAESFPPRRARAWSFYEHAWFALQAQGYELSAFTTEDRAREAHRVLYTKLLSDAHLHGVPIIRYSDLLKADAGALREALAAATGYDGLALADAVIETRQNFPRFHAATTKPD